MNYTTASTIDEYMETLPKDVRTVLENLRKTIKSAAPKAEEVISYQMPAFKYYGMLVYFAAFKNHCSFFPGGSAALAKEMEAELKPFKTSKGTLQFTVDKPLSATLVKKIVKLRVKQNEERERARELKKASTKRASKKKTK